MIVLVVAIVVVVLLGVFFYMKTWVTIQTENYRFSYPRTLSVQNDLVEDRIGVALWNKGNQVGGVTYYPDFQWEVFSKNQDPDFDGETFLKEQGVLRPEESLDEHMMEGSRKNPVIALWERRGEVKRDHYFFAGPDGCFDLWFYCDALDQSEMDSIKNSFQLEEFV